MPQHDWHGHTIDVRVVAVPKDLMAILTVDGKRSYRTYRQPRPEPWVLRFDVDEGGLAHAGHADFERLWDSLAVRYELFIDDVSIARGELKSELSWAPMIALAGIPVFFGLFVLVVAAIAR